MVTAAGEHGKSTLKLFFSAILCITMQGKNAMISKPVSMDFSRQFECRIILTYSYTMIHDSFIAPSLLLFLALWH